MATVSTVRQQQHALQGSKRAIVAPRTVISIVASDSRLTTSAPRRAFVRKLAGRSVGIAGVAAVPGVDSSILIDAPARVWDVYQTQLTANPIATKVLLGRPRGSHRTRLFWLQNASTCIAGLMLQAVISGVVYFTGDLIAQAYEGLTDGAVDTARAARSGEP